VDEVLSMEEAKLRFAKRKLRIRRCKTIPGTGLKHTASQNRDKLSAKSPRTEKPERRPQESIVVPKGDPSLGDKLAGLSKEERKQRKSADLDRVARRLAKKKRMAMSPSVGKALRKERNRIRPKVKKT
jgi:nucleolar protein 12